jgi:hypothetical protein
LVSFVETLNVPLDPVLAATGIPTLSEWGLLLLSSLLALSALFRERKRKSRLP